MPDIDLQFSSCFWCSGFSNKPLCVSKVILIAWYCTEICELFISVGSRFCAGYELDHLILVTYGDITEEPAVVDK